MKECGQLTVEEITILCDKVRDILLKENNILIMEAPITVLHFYLS